NDRANRKGAVTFMTNASFGVQTAAKRGRSGLMIEDVYFSAYCSAVSDLAQLRPHPRRIGEAVGDASGLKMLSGKAFRLTRKGPGERRLPAKFDESVGQMAGRLTTVDDPCPADTLRSRHPSADHRRQRNEAPEARARRADGFTVQPVFRKAREKAVQRDTA